MMILSKFVYFMVLMCDSYIGVVMLITSKNFKEWVSLKRFEQSENMHDCLAHLTIEERLKVRDSLLGWFSNTSQNAIEPPPDTS
mgnify:CR=1 FL=1